jgi:RNA polymerase sigma-70 factor (ECF subfamily)
MKLDPAIRDQVLATVPSLRAFAISLCGNIDRADDLVQETLLRALAHIDSFEPGTNMPAWLFTILRNLFRSEYRKRRREVEDAEGRYAETLKSHPEQTGRVEFQEFRAALAKLPADQREALILVGASGFSYDDAAAICGCAVGTIKSRVNRARTRLADLLAIDSVDDFGRRRPELTPKSNPATICIALHRGAAKSALLRFGFVHAVPIRSGGMCAIGGDAFFVHVVKT